MEKVRKATQEWCDKNGVPGPPEPGETEHGHRSHNTALHQQPGIGLVNVPIAPNSAEWKRPDGQSCIHAERLKHERRDTWNLKSVIELSDLHKNCNATGETIIVGGIHPIVYLKHAEDPKMAKYRCRIVYSAPRATTTQQGLH